MSRVNSKGKPKQADSSGHIRSAPIQSNGHHNGHNGHNGHKARPVLITGGAGFIGTNLADRLLKRGRPVLLFDNLSRPGVEQNLEWLRREHGSLMRFEEGDIRDIKAIRRAVQNASQVFHFAAQVAVTTSLTDPTGDFEVNARGTLNLLEAIRELPEPPPIIYTSTNKVYGHLGDVPLRASEGRYEPEDTGIRQHGFSEARSIHFHSPYGCSKGAAEQYVLDYARTFGLRTAVFRMSCIYGLHQFGNEDQGWVAHFLIRALNNEPITIYGDGRQVRDVLFVSDLVDAFLLAQEKIDAISGQVFNIGGGPSNTTSLLELLDLIGTLNGRPAEVLFDQWRPADQQYYVSDTRKFSAATGWVPRVDVREGVRQLWDWLQQFRTATGFRVIPTLAQRNGNGSHTRSRSLRSSTLRTGHPPRFKRLIKFTGKTGKPAETALAKAI
jgi:CDP-paratose 2-epimerase